MSTRLPSPAALIVKRAFTRLGPKAAIVVAGIAVAAATVHRTTYLTETPLGKRIAASAPVNPKTPWGTSVASASSIAPGGLDAGVDHDRINFWVDRLSTSLSSDFALMLRRKSKYADMIAAKLEAKQMPQDLVYLALIESEFNPNARSPVKAVGLWQFMSGTARRFGLRVRGHVDERKDPARETDAAVQYLSDLHSRFGSWYLAAAAYNSGEGTVLRALQNVTGKTMGTDEDFFKILPQLPKETQDYVPKLIAAARVGSAPGKYGIDVQSGSANGDVASGAAPARPASDELRPPTARGVSAKSDYPSGRLSGPKHKRVSVTKRTSVTKAKSIHRSHSR
jgi:hypothetical protein